MTITAYAVIVGIIIILGVPFLFALTFMLVNTSAHKRVSWGLALVLAALSLRMGLKPFFYYHSFLGGLKGYMSCCYFNPIEGYFSIFMLAITAYILWLRWWMFDAN